MVNCYYKRGKGHGLRCTGKVCSAAMSSLLVSSPFHKLSTIVRRQC